MQINNNYYKNYAYTNPNFNGYKTVFTKKLDEILISKRQPDINDEKFLIDKLQEFIRKKMRPNKIVGQGFHGVVYKIDDRYVLKVSHKDKPYADMLDKIKEPKFSDLKTYYGEPVAKFYDVQILKNVSSKSLHM